MVCVKHLLLIAVVGILFSCRSGEEVSDLPRPYHNLRFEKLPEVWDEALPLGNGLTGALVWQKEGKLRIAIDRADLWDLRPVEDFKSPDHSYRFICDHRSGTEGCKGSCNSWYACSICYLLGR